MSLVQFATNLVTEVPDPGTAEMPPGFEGIIAIMSWVKWAALALLVVAMTAAAVRMALAHRNGDGGQHGSAVGMTLVAAVVISAATAALGFLVS